MKYDLRLAGIGSAGAAVDRACFITYAKSKWGIT